MPFKVIEVGTNRKPVCDFLLVIDMLAYRFVLVLIELFSLGVSVTAEELRAKIDRK